MHDPWGPQSTTHTSVGVGGRKKKKKHADMSLLFCEKHCTGVFWYSLQMRLTVPKNAPVAAAKC